MDRPVDASSLEERSLEERTAHVTAREAIALLGVRLPTLYAYVSRGWVRSIPGPRRRGRLYARADLDRLKARHDARAGHAAVAVDALRWGEPVLDSAITRIDREGTFYRGHSVSALANEDVPFESVAELLWRGDMPAERARPSWRADGLGRASAKIATALRQSGTGEPLLRLMLAIPVFASADAQPAASTTDVECARARTLLVRLRSVPGIEDRTRRDRALAAPTMARGVLEAFGARKGREAERAVNRCLVVCADHELNASTFAARVAASAGCNLYACIGAALAVLSGSLHGGVSNEVAALVEKIGSPDRARSFVSERSRLGEHIPGFGHRLYPDGDPRAAVLLALAHANARRDVRVATLLAVIDAMRALGREPPNLDAGLVAVAFTLGLPAGAASVLFALGRTVGWVAHVIEQRSSAYVIRPRARYVGV
jgi:citrate synthase